MGDPEAQVGSILLGEARERHRHVRDRHALVIADAPAHQNTAADLGPVHLLHDELDEPVVHEDLITGPDLLQALRRDDGGALAGAHRWLSSEREGRAWLEIDPAATAGAERSQADLRPLEVLQDGDRTAPAPFAVAESTDDLSVLGMGPV